MECIAEGRGRETIHTVPRVGRIRKPGVSEEHSIRSHRIGAGAVHAIYI